MKWHKTNEKLPETNKQLLLLIQGDIIYSTYQMDPANIVMGVFLKNELENQLNPDVFDDRDYYFELLCCELVYAISQVIAWSYLPSVQEIEVSLLGEQ